MAIPTVPFGTDIQGWVGVTNQVAADTGDPAALGTDIVTGLNAQVTEVGVLSSLDTTDQSNLVNAMNEVRRTALYLNIALGGYTRV